MTRTLLRSRVLTVAAAGAVAAAAAACTPARASAAAFVGDQRIPAEQVSAAVDRVLAYRSGPAPAPGETAELQRQQLTRMINAEVLAVAAGEKGVTVAPGDVDARLEQLRARFGGQRELEQQAARAGVAGGEMREFVRDLALADKVGDTLVSGSSVEQVRAAHILVGDEATARRLAAQVRQDPARFAALAATYSTDAGSKDNGGDLGYQTRGAFVPAFSDAMFSARKGEVVVAHTEFGWHVIRVLDRRTVPPGPGTEQVVEQERNSRLAGLLTATARRVGVTVNPRFGRWEARTLSVVPGRDELSVPDPREGAPTNPPALP